MIVFSENVNIEASELHVHKCEVQWPATVVGGINIANWYVLSVSTCQIPPWEFADAGMYACAVLP